MSKVSLTDETPPVNWSSPLKRPDIPSLDEMKYELIKHVKYLSKAGQCCLLNSIITFER